MEKKVMLGREEVVGVATGRQVSHVTDQRERSGVEKIGKAGGYWIVYGLWSPPSSSLNCNKIHR